MSSLSALKAATTLAEVAWLLGVKPGMLSYELYKKPKVTLYSKFTIPKRFGGVREISAPNSSLKLTQHRLAKLLEFCRNEINENLGHENQVSDLGIAHGFKPRHSIVTNARAHVSRRWVFNVDLHDFFGTINFGRVRGFFILNKNFCLNPKVATVIAQIACYENKLPQGSPCSPIISNLIGHSLDILLVNLSKDTDSTYTRYVDDLTFSSNKSAFPQKVAYQTTAGPHHWRQGPGIDRSLKRAGFRLNERKTRMQYRDSRQMVTGLTVNRKPNVPTTYRELVRAMAHSLFTKGAFNIVGKADDGTGGKVRSETLGRTNQLIGMLAYIDFVDQANRRMREENGLEPINTHGRLRLFRRALYFDYFYSPSVPIIVCEGKTDNVYIRCAIKSLVAKYPALAAPGTPPKVLVRFFKYSDRRTQHITEISGGVSGLCRLIKYYHEDIGTKFRAPLPMHPVIVLIDNDSAANSVFGAIAGITGKRKPTGAASLIHVTSNLYVVPIPKGPAGEDTKIEDFFDVSTLATKLNGKSFNPKNKDSDNTSEYGKAAFAREVIAKGANTIDFTRFASILDRIVDAIADYESRHRLATATPPVATSGTVTEPS